ncbi:GNAT family N-acetyltransferase [Edwardsiella piscicida]|uniref:GNAT family N-acetyltransferase n=3 Tax=Edwardsiella TaxID=635 RepID=A0AAQ3BZM0_EDWPI|nr:GNAT family N-acetyltransferase [Edwardsiella piscicida]ACY85935.1 putative acetyltransferase [Edwardsiella tarda EIB202]ADM42901.1 Putative acetyltransferase [Edwardsiella tarda FL6-60]AOP44287.1 GNAT family N-acetyltransferase [Edwardsiella piscicida]ARD18715.1 N-acetyltransferase [Edwardsiella piscicida]EKS7767882.1 GNAT family N-acetyltransferase [Edwardsiella piscicida]
MTDQRAPDIRIRPLTAADNGAIADVIRRVSAECGLSADKGFTVSDPNLDRLAQTYAAPRCAYWIVELDGEVAGGGGVAPLEGAAPHLCELQKMYFLPALRGRGLAKRLALLALDFARAQGFTHCYLETTATLHDAIALYRHLGFEPIDAALGATRHVDCEVRMLRPL